MSKTDTPKSFRFSPDELAEFERASQKCGGGKAAVMAGIRLVNNSEPDWPTELRRLADWIEKGPK